MMSPPVNGIEMILARAEGTIQAKTPVEFDGSFIFENIPPGSYFLYADPNALEKRGLRVEPERISTEFPYAKEPRWLSELEFRLIEAA